MGWLITLGVVTLLAVLPLGVSVNYDAVGAVVRVIAGPLKITVFPLPKKEKKEKRRKHRNRKQNPGKQQRPLQRSQSLPSLQHHPRRKNPKKKKAAACWISCLL